MIYTAVLPAREKTIGVIASISQFNLVQPFMSEELVVYLHKLQEVCKGERKRNL